MGRKPRNGVHEATVDSLVAALRANGEFTDIGVHVEYHTERVDGEMDVYARRKGAHCYFEVKSSLHPRSVSRAMEQFDRVRKAYPGKVWEFYLVAPIDLSASTAVISRRVQ